MKTGLLLLDAAALGRIIQNYARAKQLRSGKQLHSQLIVSGNPQATFINNHLINMYSKCGCMEFALSLFDEIPHRNGVSWTALIAGFCQNFRFLDAVHAFYDMWADGEGLNQFVFSSVVKAGTGLGWFGFGKQVHCLAVKYGFSSELFVGSNLADMYSGNGEMVDAFRIFEEIPSKDEVCWTAMIDGYSKNEDFAEALLVFKKMGGQGVIVDQHALSSALSACGGMKVCHFGMSLHAAIVKLGYELDIIVGNALTDMYVKVGELDCASKVYGVHPDCGNIVSCTSLIDGYVESNQVEKAFNVFMDFRRQNHQPNEFTFSSLVKASASQAALELGTQLHAQVLKSNFAFDPVVSAVLLDMYGKCGLIDNSIQVFCEIEKPTEFTWNSLLYVFGQHGLGDDVIRTFERMMSRGVKPTDVTFVSLLTGCSHSGLVDKGLDYFYSMDRVYGIVPKAEHYSCVIHLLGRAGKLNEAEQFIKSMPFQPNAHGWCSFLWACKSHGDGKRGKKAADALFQLEPENSGTHILLSNIYAMNQQWENVRTVRRTMRDDNLKKLPGYSWVEFGKKTHVFGAANWSHPQQKDIYQKLDNLLEQIKAAGYVPDTDSLPVQMDINTKEIMLHHHSERIAIAFALLNMPPAKPIIVKKNLRVCVDCHSAIKLISQVVGRKIIVRDNSRFHHFDGGSCSCRDYW
uniref:DYW domain-containing protein n=1 Tax=Kalanchoe fedtschenkoi TaxID=63787 RepID=A0A7N0TZL1_KALFE